MKKLGYLCMELALFVALFATIGAELPVWRVLLVGCILGLFEALGAAKGQAA